MLKTISSISDFEQIKKTEKAFVLYITDNQCNVGESVTPKLEKLISDQFPKLSLYQTFMSQTPKLTSQLSVFVVPTILVFFEGKQYIQKSRSFSLKELEQEIARYYEMVFL